MKKLIAVAALAVVAAGGAVAGNRPQRATERRVTEAQVQAAIDARLHQMLVSMNAQHAAR